MAVENEAVVVFVPVGIVAVDFDDLGNEPPARSPLQVDDNVYGISHVGLNCAIGQIHPALQDTTCEARKTLLRGRGMDR